MMCARDLLYTTHDIRVHSSARVHSPSTLAALLRAPNGSTPAISQVLGVDSIFRSTRCYEHACCLQY
jgi:hypothetical protein